jgi:hypothetical protein
MTYIFHILRYAKKRAHIFHSRVYSGRIRKLTPSTPKFRTPRVKLRARENRLARCSKINSERSERAPN